MENDFDVEDFRSPGDFITKDELKASGPQVKRIAGVEKRDGFKDKNGKVQPELVLVFSDGRKTGLRAQVNRDAMEDKFGRRTIGWIGQVIELYVDSSVRNPQGAKVGGLRVRVPENGAAPAEYTSDLEQDDGGVSSETDEPIPF